MKNIIGFIGIILGIGFVVWIIKTMAEDIKEMRKAAKFFSGDFWMREK